MSVKIRLQRKGAKHRAFYRVVVADSRSPRDGRFVEQLGYYDPLTDPPDIKVDTDKVIGWLGKGAQPTDTVRTLFSSIGIMQMWHEHKQGKSLDELRHIEEEARQKREVKAAMGTRKKEEAKVAAKNAAAKEAEKEAAKEAAEKAAAEKAEAEKAAAEKAAEPVEEVKDESDGGEETAEKAEAGETPGEPEGGATEAPADDPPAEPEQPAGEKQADAQGSVDGDDTKAEG
ncbi:30S ribosomal protein S16 [bacterium]|nr:30S ribosomal protein S16 [bacterium]